MLMCTTTLQADDRRTAQARLHAQTERLRKACSGLRELSQLEVPAQLTEAQRKVYDQEMELVDVLAAQCELTREQLEAIKDATRGKLESMSELSEMESLRLQMAMDRLSKFLTTLSNMLKKASDTAASIVSNLK